MNATRESEAAHSDLCDQYEQQRDALADHLASVRWDNAATRMDRRRFWRERADAVLAVLHTRTVAQVKAEALREAAALVESPELGLGSWLRRRADRLEREGGR